MGLKILVPTDFSENSISATHYACHSAQGNGLAIHLFHCYTSETSAFDESSTDQEYSIKDRSPILKADVLMSRLVNELKSQYPTLQISDTCTRGLIDEKLPLEANKPEYRMIVMGAKGGSTQKSYYWGSTTVAISTKSPVPVLAVPKKYQFRKSDHIALLTKFKPEEMETLREYVEILGNVKKLTLIHVYRESADKEEVMDKLKSWQFTFQELGIVPEVAVHSDHILSSDVNLDTVPEVVNKLIGETNPDTILVTKTRKTFFQRLFTSSVSKALTLELQKPAFFDKIVE